MLVGCQTKVIETPKFVFPTFDTFEPPRVPTNLIEEPMTDADILHNSVQFEFLLYDWQDYADGLSAYVESIRDVIL